MIDKLKNNKNLLLVGHRGYKAAFPENTLLSFYEALELGVDVLEFDLHFSKDKEIVIIHDDTVDRTTNSTGKVGDFTLQELKQLDAGGWFHQMFEGLKIPTLHELCELLVIYPDVLLNVEIKASETALEVTDAAMLVLEQYGLLSRCLFTSFDANVVSYIHDHHQKKTQGFPAEKMFNFVEGEQGTYSKMWSIGISRSLLTSELVDKYRSMGMVVGCYCTDTAAQVQFALDCGVNLVTCDDPIPAIQFRNNTNHRLLKERLT